ncbi:MAG: four helix bundle protein [Pseudomonadota bacterium]
MEESGTQAICPRQRSRFQNPENGFSDFGSLLLAGYLRLQLLRASSSICLNLAEGTGRASRADRRRFYSIALGSLREVEAILRLERGIPVATLDLVDHVGACLYRLVHSSV